MYTYRLTQSALNDLQQITDYISDGLFAPDSAEALIQSIRESILNACTFPLSLAAPRDPQLRAKGYRAIFVKNYIVFTIPDSQTQTLNVMRVLYYAQNYKALL